MSTRTLSDGLARLHDALTILAEADLAGLCAAAQLDALRDLQTSLTRLDAQLTRLVTVVHRQGSVREDGALSTTAWMRSQLHAGGEAQRIKATATLAALPEMEAAYLRGELALTHVAAAAGVVKDIEPQLLAGGIDKLLVEQALTQNPTAFKRTTNKIREHYNPDAANERNRDQMGEQWFKAARTFGGAVSFHGQLAPDTGEQLLQLLNAFMPPPKLDDPRLAPQRRADALLDLCRIAADHAPQAGGEKPHLTITVDWETLRDQLTTDLFRRDGGWTGAHLGHGVTLRPDTARRLACDCNVIPAVLGGASEPLDIGRATRVIPAAIRRALVLRDGGCRFPGCDRPAEWTDAHHLRHWLHGGHTKLDNLVLVCRRHHVMLHETGWTISYDHHTGQVTATDPHGRPLGIISYPRAKSP